MAHLVNGRNRRSSDLDGAADGISIHNPTDDNIYLQNVFTAITTTYI